MDLSRIFIYDRWRVEKVDHDQLQGCPFEKDNILIYGRWQAAYLLSYRQIKR
jgi:hypothetical protein